MSERDEALREMAANRGCKLVKSRVRTPGRGDYGRFGLKDAKSGKEVLGFGRKGLTATAAEVEAFLRGGAAARWKNSLGGLPSRRKAKTTPQPPPEPKSAEPKLVLREARPKDSEALAALISALGYEASAGDVRKRLAALKKAGEPALVAERGALVGCATLHVTPVLHRPRPVGRITMLVVAESERGKGIGAALVAEVEARLAAKGVGLVEVTSNVKRLRAHDFYAKLGYERASYRFAKPLGG